MNSKIAKAIRMKYSLVALTWSDEKPKGAIEFVEGKWGCLMSLAASAAKGKVAAASRETCGCNGGYVGAGFGDKFEQIPGGIERFLSSGNPDLVKTEEGRELAEAHPDMLHGERYIKTPEFARKFVESLPVMNIPAKYIVFKPLEMLGEDEIPKSIIFMVNPDQLSALVVLANYGRETTDNVTMPMGAGCHQIGVLVYREDESEQPKAIVGLTDISARKYTNPSLGKDILSFSIPYKMFLEMEDNVEGSFLGRDSWAEVVKISGLYPELHRRVSRKGLSE